MIFRVKAFYYVLIILFLHYVIGWIAPVIFTALFAGIMLEDYRVIKSSVIGILVNGAGVAFTYIYYSSETIKMATLMDQYLTNLTPWAILVISVLMPTLLYALAAYMGANATYVIQKMRVNNKLPYQKN